MHDYSEIDRYQEFIIVFYIVKEVSLINNKNRKFFGIATREATSFNKIERDIR